VTDSHSVMIAMDLHDGENLNETDLMFEASGYEED
jgi:hypothetical protein